ncbi:hypothetical protein DFH08DRAFT_732733 [Mycena albidolilacea]|uniref:F-box domain-containing protein n=1 Tax=Mycena albidolilacea TaxID=1033008 RepID=A0AAD7AJZ6_9AGAR|nr:hypothetical protein DFH08DRAFT_732733 [Mycena albidolilacea]
MSCTQSILLRPRPYAQHAGSFFLVALLPPPKIVPSLPSELWLAIFEFVAIQPGLRQLWSLLTVCRQFKEIVLPLLYARVATSNTHTFEKFVARLHFADQRWDSIRRIPFSTPGRWVQILNLSCIEYTGRTQALVLDSLLVKLFALVPFLARLSMNPSFVLSRRAMESLGQRAGADNIRALEGISYTPSGPEMEEPLIQLLRCCPNLEELELIGRGLDPAEMDPAFQTAELSVPDSFIPFALPCLRTLTIISVYSSTLLLSLLLSPLPALQKLTITPYDDVPTALSSQFIAAHGASLRSLLLFTPKSWPTRLHPSPHTVLCTSPTLRHLSLERPLPSQLTIPAGTSHPLQILSVPRPDPDFWTVLERLLPRLPALRAVRARDVRWLRKGMGSSAQAAGVQGELREWRRRLLRRGIRVFDAEWNECE